MVFTPHIPFDNTKQRLSLLQAALNDIKVYISKICGYLASPVISGANLYSLIPPTEK